MDRESKVEVTRWVDQLLASTDRSREEAASELARMGVFTRRSMRSRGSLMVPGDNRLPEPDKLPDLLKYLNDKSKGVRCHVALALGEWGGEDAATSLANCLKSELDEEVKLFCITGLKTVGGPAATSALAEAAENGSEAIRSAALEAIEELATEGGRLEDTERPTAVKREMVQARAIVIGRGKRRRGQGGDVLANVVGALGRLRSDAHASRYLRQRAEDVLGYLNY